MFLCLFKELQIWNSITKDIVSTNCTGNSDCFIMCGYVTD